jgi:hypothetical protein
MLTLSLIPLIFIECKNHSIQNLIFIECKNHSIQDLFLGALIQGLISLAQD